MSEDSDFSSLQKEVAYLNGRVLKMESNLKSNTEATARVEKNTEDIVEFFTSVKGAFKVFEFIGRLAKPVAVISSLLLSLVGLWQLFKAFFKIGA